MKMKRILKEHGEVYHHTVSVADLATDFATFTGMFEIEEVEVIRKGSILHDIGKLFIPKNILYKTGKLSGSEFEVIKKHSQYGYNFLISGDPLGNELNGAVEVSDNGFLEEASDLVKQFPEITDPMLSIVLQHHERIDGSGYPFGAKGNEIHLYAKLVSICDVYDAVTSTRCYKPQYDYEFALNIIEKGSGTQFDEPLAKKFVNFIRNAWIPKGTKN